MKTQTTPSADTHSARAVSLIIVYVVLGDKKMAALKAYLGDLAGSIVRKEDGWEIAALRKNAEKLLKKIAAFFDEENVSCKTKDGMSRLVIPFKKIFTKKRAAKMGLTLTPIGFVFSKCALKVEESLRPVVKDEDIDFKKWDDIIDSLLASYTEKKQYAARKWLEMTEPVVRNSEF